MSELQKYHEHMRNGLIDACIAIELRYGLYGYPPELVSVGLKAVDDGFCPIAAIDTVIHGNEVVTQAGQP